MKSFRAYLPENILLPFFGKKAIEDTVRRDILNWRGKLKKRSILCGHDWHLGHIEVAVTGLLGRPKFGDDDIWYFEYL